MSTACPGGLLPHLAKMRGPQYGAASPPHPSSLLRAADAYALRLPRITRAPGVYMVYVEPLGRCYVGSTTCLRKRYDTHWGKLRRANHENARLQAAWDAHGANAVRFAVLEELPPSAALDEAEPVRLARENAWLTAIVRDDLFNVTIPAVASLRTSKPRTRIPHPARID
mgnify:CR=1 FL=1